jgi:hypothetical protein
MQCEPKVMKVAARLARLQTREDAKADVRRARQRRKDAKLAARLADGPRDLLGVPWELVEDLIVTAIGMEDGDPEDIDVDRIAGIAWKLIEQTGLVPAPLRSPAVSGLVIAFVLAPMVRAMRKAPWTQRMESLQGYVQ